MGKKGSERVRGWEGVCAPCIFSFSFSLSVSLFLSNILFLSICSLFSPMTEIGAVRTSRIEKTAQMKSEMGRDGNKRGEKEREKEKWPSVSRTEIKNRGGNSTPERKRIESMRVERVEGARNDRNQTGETIFCPGRPCRDHHPCRSSPARTLPWEKRL